MHLIKIVSKLYKKELKTFYDDKESKLINKNKNDNL